MSADLRTVVARLTTFRCTWTAQEVAALVDVPLSGVRRYLSTLVHLAVLTVTDGKHGAGPAARAWREREPKRKGPSTYGNSARYRAQRQVWDQLRTRDWQEGRKAKGGHVLTSQEPTEPNHGQQEPTGANKMPKTSTSGVSLTYAEAASELNVHEETIRREVQRGRLVAFQVGLRGRRITREALDAYRTASLTTAASKA